VNSSRPYLFLAANTRWVYALAEAISHDVPVHAVRFHDWQTYWKNRPSWPDKDPEASLKRTHRVLPTGYAGTLEWLARPFMRHMIRSWRDDLKQYGNESPYVVVPYPYLAPWVRDVSPDRLVYYNLDAYTLYRPERAKAIRRKEAELVERAGLTVCLSKVQVEALRSRHPESADRIRHFPLGVLEEFLNPDPKRDPEPRTIGYVGNLTDRVDWAFVQAVVERCPDLRFIFAGGLNDKNAGEKQLEWRRTRAAVLQRPNVEHLGRIPQDDVTELYWNCAVNWIPYDADHPFNRASCPTKVMDAIASGRPVVSTPVPECELYPEWIDTVETAAEASKQLYRALDRLKDDSSHRQVRFARQNTWGRRANELCQMLEET
jgi:glycosyltransferase involved in cell wall biosynthesis